MLLDWFCVEACRGCRQLIAGARDGPHTACRDCWMEHAHVAAHLEVCSGQQSQGTLLVTSGTTYSGVLKKMLYGLKYDRDLAVMKDLAPLACSAWEKLAEAAPQSLADAVLVPVPLHLFRMIKRGYNQAELVAQAVSRKFQLRVETRLLGRARSTRAQHGLGREQRRTNVAGAFKIRERYLPENGVPIVLVDDIYTSGATMAEIAHQLRQAGCQHVYAISCARATLD